MNIVGIVPARAGSKGIVNKNMQLILDRHLIEYTFQAAMCSKKISKIYLTTDDENIIKLADKYEKIIVPFVRPENLSADNVGMLEVVKHLLSNIKENEGDLPDAIVLLQPTSPLRESNHIDEACDLLIENSDLVDTVVSVNKVPHHYTPDSIYRLNKGYLEDYIELNNKIYDRHSKDIFYARNGPSVLVSKVKHILENNGFYGKTLPYFMTEEESFDIDTEFDLKIVRMLMSAK